MQSVGGTCGQVCGPLTDIVSSVGGVPADRVYVNFEGSFTLKSWAMGGSTFA